MPKSNVEIHLSPGGKCSSVKIDGEEWAGRLRSVDVKAHVDTPTTVTLEVVNCDVTVTGEANLVIDTTTLAHTDTEFVAAKRKGYEEMWTNA